MSTPSEQPAGPPRPRQVTLAAWLIMTGSVIVVLTVFDRVSTLHSLETREAVTRFVHQPPGDSLGLEVEGVLSLLRVVAMVAAACATATAILGYQVLRRSRSARVALAVLALPVMVSGLAAGGVMSSVVAAASAMLWLSPAREWFRGESPAPRPERAAAPPAPPAGGAPWSPPSSPPTHVTPYAAGPGPWAPPGPSVPARPAPVSVACVLTWCCAAGTAVLLLLSLAVLVGNPGVVLTQLHDQNPDLARQGVSDHDLQVATFVLLGVCLVWSLAAVLLAFLVWRRVAWARAALVVSASATGVLLLLASFGQPLLVVPLGAAVATMALLVRPDVKAWFVRR
ncbi:MAG: hypothetical protein ACXVW0_04515 [Nocardioides sp.]